MKEYIIWNGLTLCYKHKYIRMNKNVSVSKYLTLLKYQCVAIQFWYVTSFAFFFQFLEFV